MATLQAVLDETAFSSLDESLKGFYTQNNETKQYYANVANPDALAFNLKSEVEKLKAHNGTLLTEKKTLQEKYKPFEAFGKTVDEIKAVLETNRPEEVTKMVSEYEAKLKSVEDSYKESLQKENELRAKAQANLEKTLQDSTIAKLRADFGLNDTAEYVLRDFIKPVRNDETGDISMVVFENGNPVLVAGQPKTPEQLLSGFKENGQFLSIFNASSDGGAGGTNRHQGVSGNNTISSTDTASIAANLDKIATGEIKVV